METVGKFNVSNLNNLPSHTSECLAFQALVKILLLCSRSLCDNLVLGAGVNVEFTNPKSAAGASWRKRRLARGLAS